MQILIVETVEDLHDHLEDFDKIESVVISFESNHHCLFWNYKGIIIRWELKEEKKSFAAFFPFGYRW